VQTDRGILTLELSVKEGRVEQVRVDMGEPILEPARIPVALGGARVINAALPMPDCVLSMTCVFVAESMAASG